MDEVGLELTAGLVLVGSLAAFVFGLSKTALPAAGAFGVAIMATVLPPLASTGVVLPLLLVGDAVALSLYGRHVDRGRLLHLVPSVALGLLGGYALAAVGGGLVDRLIGVVLVLSGGGELLRRRRRAAPTEPMTGSGRHRLGTQLLGVSAGVATMVANAGGPMMSVYLVREAVGVRTMLGTAAWFFAIVNLVKVPMSAALGLITTASLPLSAALVPGLLAGAATGRWLARVAPARTIEVALMVLTLAAGLWLVLG